MMRGEGKQNRSTMDVLLIQLYFTKLKADNEVV